MGHAQAEPRVILPLILELERQHGKGLLVVIIHSELLPEQRSDRWSEEVKSKRSVMTTITVWPTTVSATVGCVDVKRASSPHWTTQTVER